MDFINKLDPEQQANANKIADEAIKIGVDPRLAVALAFQESSLRHGKTGEAGEIGIMQVRPTTAKMIGFDPKELNNPDRNIQIGLTYLKQGIDRHKDPVLAAAGYNAGMDHPFFADPTKDLPKSTMNYLESIKGLGGFTGAAPQAKAEPSVTEGTAGTTQNTTTTPASEQDFQAMKARALVDIGAAGAGAVAAKGLQVGSNVSQTAQAIRDIAKAKAAAAASPSILGAPAGPVAPGPQGLPPAQGPLSNAPAGGRMTQNWLRSQDVSGAGAYELEAQKARDMKEAHQMKRAAMAAEDKIRAIAPEMRQVPERAGLFLPESAGRGPRGMPNVPIPPVQPPAPPGALQQVGTAAKNVAGAAMRSPVVGGALGGLGAAESGMEVMSRMRQKDPIGAAIASAGALGGGMMMIPHPATKIGGAALSAASPLALYLYDKMRKTSPETAQQMLTNVDLMGSPMP